MTYSNKASYDSTPPCIVYCISNFLHLRLYSQIQTHTNTVHFHTDHIQHIKRALAYTHTQALEMMKEAQNSISIEEFVRWYKGTVPWLLHMCAMTPSYMCRDSFICVTHSYVCHDSFTWRKIPFTWHEIAFPLRSSCAGTKARYVGCASACMCMCVWARARVLACEFACVTVCVWMGVCECVFVYVCAWVCACVCVCVCVRSRSSTTS